MTSVSRAPSEPFDPSPILARMKAFQRKTVDHVFRRFYEDDVPAKRFLVADEVGLGKTLVARGVIAKAIAHLEGTVGRIDIVYVCSNAAIARQNIARLNVAGLEEFALSTRLTLLPSQLRQLESRRMNFISFTPGTTFDIKQGGGLKEERAVLYSILRPSKLVNVAGLHNLLRGSVGAANWRALTDQATKERLDAALCRSFLKDLEADEAFLARLELGAMQHRYRRGEPDGTGWKLIGELRARLARTCLEALEPDLIILDEFQRFKSLLGGETEAAQLAQHLFDVPTARVLLLSATPYSMLSLDHEHDNDHYTDFLATLRFLFDDPAAVAGVQRDLDTYRTALLELPAASGAGNRHGKRLRVEAEDRARTASATLRERLLQVMCRTERVGITRNRDAMLDEPKVDLAITPPDLSHARLLLGLAETLGTYDVVEFWKSGDYVLNFMRRYDLGKRIERRGNEPGIAESVWRLIKNGRTHLLSAERFDRFEPLEPASGRLRHLLAETVDRGLWRLLWLPPSMPYTKPHGAFADVGDVSKMLVFSSWNFVPDAIAVVASYEAERRMLGGAEAGVRYSEVNTRIHRMLQFQVRPRETGGEVSDQFSGMTALGLQYPSSWLAAQVDPLRLALDLGQGRGVGKPVSASAMLRAAEQKLAPEIAAIVDEHARSERPDKRWYWAILALLDRKHHPAAIDWVLAPDGWRAMETDPEARASETVDPAKWRSGATEDGFSQHVRHFHAAAQGDLELGRPPRDLVRVVAEIALAGPAVCALRALGRIAPELAADAPRLLCSAARVASGFRTLFNLSETVALLRSGSSDEAYWRRVLQYGLDGNLQAVLDEQAHVLAESLGVTDRLAGERVDAVSATLASALSVRTSNLSLDQFSPGRDRTSTTIRPFTVRCRFALRFAQIKDERESTLGRIETVRDAFNSPFRPFVLTTTSIGQEGLDFHTWCHKLVHWNLPSNPVDLEQREGRVHRYKGHAVRKNIARHYGLRALAEGWASGEADRFCGGWDGPDGTDDAARAAAEPNDPWSYLFRCAAKDVAQATEDLSPYWVFETSGGSKIERLVPMLPFSREVSHLDNLKRSLAIYRLAFGQARQEDLLRFLTVQLGPKDAERMAAEIGLSLKP